MAVEVESTNQVEEFLGLIKRRLVWIIHPVLIMVSIGVCVAVVIPKKFVTSTKVLVRDTSAPGGSSSQLGQDTTGEARMAGHQIKSLNRIQAVLLDLEWPEFLEITRGEKLEYVKAVRENIDVDVPSTPNGTGQVIVTVKYAHTDGQSAFDFLTELVEKWKEEVLAQGKNAEVAAFQKLRERKLELEDLRETLTDQITQRLKDYNIPVSAPNQRGGGQVQAPIFDKLAKHEEELGEISLEIQQLETQLAADREQYNREPEMISAPESDRKDSTQARIDTLRENILKTQQEISEGGYKPSHSKYTKLRAKIDGYEQEIRILEDAPIAEIEEAEMIPNHRREKLLTQIELGQASLGQLKVQQESLEEAIEKAKAESAELQEVIAEIEVWQAERGQVNIELEDVTRQTARKQQAVQWVEGPAGNPFEVLESVELPTKPSEPNPVLVVMVFLFLGCGLGLALALVGELTRNCFRTVGDVGRVMFVPVLGTINAIETRAQRARRFASALLLTGLSLGTITLFGFITWAWTARPDLLSDRVTNAIEGFRQNFM